MSVTLSLLHNPFGGLWLSHFSPPLRNTVVTIPLPDSVRSNCIKKSPLMIVILRVFLVYEKPSKKWVHKTLGG
jgi:hypothetical protein